MIRSVLGRSTVVIATVALAAVGLSACAGANNNNSSSNNGGSGGSGGSGSSVLTIQGDAGDPTLTENFNPFSTTQLEGTRLIYEPLGIPSSVNGSYIPFLATKYSTPNPTTLVFTLRSGVKWSDGKPFSAADVVYTFNLLKKNAALDITGVWAQLSSVTSSGNTVTMKLKAPNVPFAGTIAQVPIVPEHLWKSVPDASKYTNTKPVGTGPFELEKFAPTEYTLKNNPNYWQASVIAPTTVDIPAQSSNQSTNQLNVTSGKLDWAYNFIPNVKQTFVARDPQHNKYWFPPGGTIGLFLNLTKAPYNDPNFRAGISYSLDRSTIAQKAVNGYTGAASSSGLILPNLQRYLDPSLPNQGVIKQDTAKAMAAFHKAGYTQQGGKLVKNGQQASIKISLPNNFSDWVAAATEIKNELGKVGVSVTLDEPQYAQYEKEIGSGSFDAAMGGFGGSGNPYTDFNNALNSQYATPINTATVNNFERFKDPTVDKYLANLAAATTPSAQVKATYPLEKYMFTKQPIILMYYGGSWGLFSTKNFTGWPSAQDPYMLPTTYNNAILVVLTHLKKA
jgi:peptide/nickel transport system substrate-binding protein